MSLTDELTSKLKVSANGTLIISSARKNHQGRYTCRALNKVGQDLTATISITVHGFYPLLIPSLLKMLEGFPVISPAAPPIRFRIRLLLI